MIHGSVFGLAAVGSIAVGYLIDEIGYVNTVWCMAAVLLVGILYTVLLLKDSKPSHQEPGGLMAMGRKVLSAFSMWCRDRESKNDSTIFLLTLSALVCCFLVCYGRTDIDTLFFVGEPFSMDSVDVGYAIGWYSLSRCS